jgi:hypothetical protein
MMDRPIGGPGGYSEDPTGRREKAEAAKRLEGPEIDDVRDIAWDVYCAMKFEDDGELSDDTEAATIIYAYGEAARAKAVQEEREWILSEIDGLIDRGWITSKASKGVIHAALTRDSANKED